MCFHKNSRDFDEGQSLILFVVFFTNTFLRRNRLKQMTRAKKFKVFLSIISFQWFSMSHSYNGFNTVVPINYL